MDSIRRRAQDGSTGAGASSASAQDDDQLDSNNRTTETQTMMHILKANIGTGVLAMPLAFKNVGLWLGLVLVPLIGIICIHCMNILISSHNKLCDKFNYESLDYDQVAALGLACGPKWARRLSKRASIIVTTFLMFTQIGFCCVYILFTVENLQVVCMNLFGLEYSMLTYLLVIFPIIGLTSCTSNLKHLARISTLANLLQLAGLALILFDLLQFHTYANTYEQSFLTQATSNSSSGGGGADQLPQQQQQQHQPDIKVEQTVGSRDLLSGLPLFFATAVYAFEGIGVVLPLVKEMQHPVRISGPNGVLNTSMSMVALLYMAMGFFGYTKYGQTVAGSITLNLPRTTLNELVRLAFALAIGLSYSLQFYVPWTIVWPWIDEGLFYAYRPRVARNKLSILDELSASNHWALSKVLEEKQRVNEEDEVNGDHSAPGGATFGQQVTSTMTADFSEYNDNSLATTLATSYSMSVSVAPGSRQGAHLKSLSKSTSLSLARQFQPPGQQYGALASSALDGAGDGGSKLQARLTLPTQQVAPTTTTATGRHRRNRLEDVMEASSDELPEVQWRPPPRSMRGKRKLVRYTVILLTVSFTFVAAALIPRLDLFISLIGALASSSLAIIFPAIIQLCTFWNGGRPAHNFRQSAGERDGDEDEEEEEDNEDDDDDDDDDDTSKRNEQQPETAGQSCYCCCRQNRPSNAKLVEASLRPLLPDCRHCRRRRRRRWQNSILWHLFVLKNMLLVLFGVLGLITGTWVSLNQLSASAEQV